MSFMAHIAEQHAGPLRVLIADDHAPTREDVRRALTDGGLVVCA
jgi:PleD family two-component response regulator